MWRSAFRVRPVAALAGASVAGGALAAGHVASVNVLPVAHAADELKSSAKATSSSLMTYVMTLGVPAVAICGATAFFITTFYKTCPPSALMCVYGANRGGLKIIKGGGTIVVPGFQQYKML